MIVRETNVKNDEQFLGYSDHHRSVVRSPLKSPVGTTFFRVEKQFLKPSFLPSGLTFLGGRTGLFRKFGPGTPEQAVLLYGPNQGKDETSTLATMVIISALAEEGSNHRRVTLKEWGLPTGEDPGTEICLHFSDGETSIGSYHVSLQRPVPAARESRPWNNTSGSALIFDRGDFRVGIFALGQAGIDRTLMARIGSSVEMAKGILVTRKKHV
jgi:hypothetical protein